MRKIIFRAKRIDNKEWMYGSLVCRVKKDAKQTSAKYSIVLTADTLTPKQSESL